MGEHEVTNFEELASLQGMTNINTERKNIVYRFFSKLFSFVFRRSQLKKIEKEAIRKLHFSTAEMRTLQNEVASLKPEGPWVTIREINFPVPGHIFRLNENARYKLLKPGSLVLVQQVPLIKIFWADKEYLPEVLCLSLDEAGKLIHPKPWTVRVSDLETVDDEKTCFQNWEAPVKKFDTFFDGDPIETADEILFGQEGMSGAMAFKLPNGLKGIVDSPEVTRGQSLDELNSPYIATRKTSVLTAFTIYSDKSQRHVDPKEMTIPFGAEGETYNVYFPSLRNHFKLNRSQIRRCEFRKELIERVIMDDDTKNQILSLVNGDEKDLKRWGVSSFQKGTGRIFLAYGPPGTGKTLTGQMLAEYLERPLYMVNSADLGLFSRSFEIDLKQVIERTARWNAVTIIDEAETILQSRDFMMAESVLRVTAVLRNLERLERGIIWFTTNRPFDIDFAIESRIRAQIYFAFPDAEKREKLWRITLPVDMEVEGMDDQNFKKVAEIELDGREIKNAIQNAADMASSHKLETVPASYLLTAAKIISKNKETMAAAKQSGGRQPIKRPGQYL